LKDGEWTSADDADWQGWGRKPVGGNPVGHGRTNHGMGSFLSHLFSTVNLRTGTIAK
jgi:hypothetical protein